MNTSMNQKKLNSTQSTFLQSTTRSAKKTSLKKKLQQNTLSPRKFTLNSDDLSHYKDLCQNLHLHSLYHRKESSLKSLQAINKLKELMEKAEEDELMDHFNAEALAAVINQGLRSSLIKNRYINSSTYDKDITTLIQQHRDEFMQQIWSRSLNIKRDMKALFQQGSGMINRLGEQISQVTLDLCYSAEKAYVVNFVNDGCLFELLERDDLMGLLSRKVYLFRPLDSKVVQVSANRYDFILRPKRPKVNDWGCVHATRGVMRAYLGSKPLELEFIDVCYHHLLKSGVDTAHPSSSSSSSFLSSLPLMALLMDELHPGHQLHAEVITYPMQAVMMMKRKLWALGYDESMMDSKLLWNVLDQMKLKWMEHCRCMFEFSVPPFISWRVGVCFDQVPFTDIGFPGHTEFSFGIGSDGHVYWQNQATVYMTEESRLPYNGVGFRTFAVIIDFYEGSIHLANDQHCLPAAFGFGANHFSVQEQAHQSYVIKTKLLVPMFALEGMVQGTEGVKDQLEMRVNFGWYPFQCTIVPSQSMDGLFFLPSLVPKLDVFSGIDSPSSMTTTTATTATATATATTTTTSSTTATTTKLDFKDKEEEEKLYLAFEKNQYRNAMALEEDKSWSQFPPSVYRRSFAATKIQRAYRIFKGRQFRQALWKLHHHAASVIQRAARKRLAYLHYQRELAAFKIQKNWRHTVYLKLCLLSMKYRKPLSILHEAAKRIQIVYLEHTKSKYSSCLTKFGKTLVEMQRAVEIISNWWKPILIRLRAFRAKDKIRKAATQIQKTWRGHKLRQALRPDIRAQLHHIGKLMLHHRTELLYLQSVLIIQRAYREYSYKKIRSEKIRTRNNAATRIQRTWKGYWIRSHISTHFDYGEVVFLTAVCKCLKNAHFILKMYKPCGIVCPKREFRGSMLNDYLP